MKRSIKFYLSILFLSLGYHVVNSMVYLTNGHAWLVRKKIKMGALIVVLTGIFACNSPKTEKLPVTCYEPMATDNKDDSIAQAKKLHDDSIAKVAEELRIKDSIAKVKQKTKIKKPKVIEHKCYVPVKPKDKNPNL